MVVVGLAQEKIGEIEAMPVVRGARGVGRVVGAEVGGGGGDRLVCVCVFVDGWRRRDGLGKGEGAFKEGKGREENKGRG